jgi:crotonobetainyl-CoA:carnitine CoA-transferase CaiB-like acyl-CoA transferase
MTKLPLEGIRIVGMPVVVAGPYATMMLADMGAEVILVESIQHFPPVTRGAFARPPQFIVPTTTGSAGAMSGGNGGMSTYFDHWAGSRPWDRYAMFNVLQRNKYSCCIDVTRPKGLEVFKRLVQKSDVFLENTRPGSVDKLGITYEALKEVKPDIIHINMPALGCYGRHSKAALFGAQLQALGGHTYLTRYPDEDYTTTQSLLFHGDASAGANAAFAILCALQYRKRTGKGQHIDLSQLETVIPHFGEAIMEYTMNERVMEPLGNRDAEMAPQGVYRCYGEDGWVVITVDSDKAWQGLCRAIGDPEWGKDPRFATVKGRMENHDEIDKYIEEWTCRHDNYEAMWILQKEGVAAGPVINDRDITHDPHLAARGFFEIVKHRETGVHMYPGMCFKMSKTPLKIRKAAPCLGEDNDYVYKKVIGMKDAEIKNLEKEQIIGGDEYVEGVGDLKL